MRGLTRCHDARSTASAACLSLHTRGIASRVRRRRSKVQVAVVALTPSSIGDRVSLDRAYVDISADLGGSVVEHGFHVKSTARSIIDIHHDPRLRRPSDADADPDVVPNSARLEREARI